eukprot:jgi/Astpho2/7074/Aster-x0753
MAVLPVSSIQYPAVTNLGPGHRQHLLTPTGDANGPAQEQPAQNWPPLPLPVTPADTFPQGLRGLHNMGNTCFVSCILQVLIHAPLLRTFFLSGGHVPALCPTHRPAAPGSCLSCSLAELFEEVYGGSRQPLAPARLLADYWALSPSPDVREQAQQDAHDFFLFLLAQISGTLDLSPSASRCGRSVSPSPGPTSGEQRAPAGSFVAVAPPQDMAAEASLRDWHIAMPSDMELRSLGPFMQQAPAARAQAPEAYTAQIYVLRIIY